MSIRSTDRFVRNADLVTREIAGETLLVPVTGKLADLADMFSLNPTGAYIWEQLDGQASAEGICAGLVTNFEVEPEQAWADTAELLEALLNQELISVSTPTAAGEQ